MTEQRPLVCICVPTYNAAATLAATLESILAQTYRDISVLVVDNASTDDTAGIARAFAARDPRLQLVSHAENVGAEGNFDRCLALARGAYTAIFHSDDIYTPAMVAEEVAFLEAHPEAGAVFAMTDTIDEDGPGALPGRPYRLPPGLRPGPSGLFTFPEIFRAMLRNGNFLLCPGAMARTEVYRDHVKKWSSARYGSSSDLGVWLKILEKYPIGVINKPLFRYRVSRASFSYGAGRAKTGPHDMLAVFEDYINGFARNIAGPAEKAAFFRLVTNDNVNRAFNLAAGGKEEEARALLAGVFCAKSLAAAASLYHFKTLLLALLTRTLMILPLTGAAKKKILELRYRTRG